MIYTITLNPAIDKRIILNNFKIDGVNRFNDEREDAGGKGINVSKMIHNLGGNSTALGVVAGASGHFIKDQLDKMGILHSFIEGEGNTRTNLKIVDPVHQTYTDINEEGKPISDELLEQMEKHLFEIIQKGDILVLAGSVPNNVSKDIYGKWIKTAKENDIKVLLDAEGELLKQGILAGPYLIKPNIHELEGLLNKKIETQSEVIECGKKLLDHDIKVVVISRGSEGCILISEDKVLHIPGLVVDVKSTVGAGDSMVGALAYALELDYSLEEAIALGVASSTATIQEEGSIMGSLENIIKMKSIVEVHQQ
ncbi:MAG: 1-phosphofructokinase [Firmicutes bacterium HGW-Firmicutes-1]|jgi:1-phosphofructokinase|nr:MAG: 1-phosphofructokinase [Firmicutes bacterium HGW-Firmicutes-1]